jgi:hypothetical protein
VSYLFDSKVQLDPVESETCTTTLECLMTDSHLRELMGEASSKAELRSLLEAELSDLVARFEVSVDPRADSHWWTPLTFKKSPITLRLSHSVQRLKGAWTLFMNDRVIQQARLAVEESVLQHLKDDSSRNWRDALYAIHSPGSQQSYTSPSPISVRRHSQMVTGSEPANDEIRRGRISSRTLGGNSPPNDGNGETTTTPIPKCVRYTLDASDVAKFERDYAERKRFSERVRRSLHETRSSFILS